jgi:hypothetical protein
MNCIASHKSEFRPSTEILKGTGKRSSKRPMTVHKLGPWWRQLLGFLTTHVIKLDHRKKLVAKFWPPIFASAYKNSSASAFGGDENEQANQ